MVTRAEGVQGFPSILNEMLWRGNFLYQPEYSVYARGLGPGMVDYFATMFIPMRLVEGVNHSHNFVAHGTSVGMTVQEVAYNAMTHLRSEIPELWMSPFQHFPMRGPQPGVNLFSLPTQPQLIARQIAGIFYIFFKAFCKIIRLFQIFADMATNRSAPQRLGTNRRYARRLEAGHGGRA
jgi:hypothetical protein